jgi:hypothetical protein
MGRGVRGHPHAAGKKFFDNNRWNARSLQGP